MKHNINFESYFKKFNIFSIAVFFFSIILIIFKGLNYGIDFKGGTLLEISLNNDKIKIGDIRDSLNKLDLGDVNVKNFGKDGHYLINIEKKFSNNQEIITDIKKSLNTDLQSEINYRRIENVGPKVSAELLNSGLLAISLALGAMLFFRI